MATTEGEADETSDDEGHQDHVALQIIIPEDGHPGETLEFCHNGRQVELTIPEGSKPGDVLEIIVGQAPLSQPPTPAAPEEAVGENASALALASASTDMNDEEVDAVTEVVLHLSMGSPKLILHAPPKAVGAAEAAAAATIAETETNKGDGTCCMVWPTAHRFCQFLTSTEGQKLLMSQTESQKRINVLELGSGLGPCGLACAASLGHVVQEKTAGTGKQQGCDISSAHIYLTDINVHGLQANVDHNSHLWKPPNQKSATGIQVHVNVHELDWSNPPDPSRLIIHDKKDEDSTKDEGATAWDWIVGCDLMYHKSSHSKLIQTIQSQLSDKTRVLLALRWRDPQAERHVLEQLSQTLDFELLLGGTNTHDTLLSSSAPFGCPLPWEVYGDPTNEESNQYFLTTSIPIQALSDTTPVPLANISEPIMAKMTYEEYQAYEEAQMQLYVGRPKSSRKRKN